MTNLLSSWRASRRAQILLISVAFLVLLTTFGAWYWLSAEPYQVVFSGLRPVDAGTISSELQKHGIAFQASEDGTAILVRKSEVNAARSQVLSRDLPLKGTVGFELFDNSDLGVSDFSQRINFQRALQGELERTLLTLPNVSTARVHLVLPEETVFRRQAQRAKASVSLGMRENVALTATDILRVQRMVAAGVPHLEPADVNVLDERSLSTSLSSTPDTSASLITDPALRQKAEIEQYYVSKLTSMLVPIVGNGNVMVRVDATLTRTETQLTEENASIRRRAGMGVDAAIPPSRLASAPTTLGTEPILSARKKANETRGDEPNDEQSTKRVEHSTIPSGSIQKLQVAVVLHTVPVSVNVANVKAVIATAAGINAARGDVLSVVTQEITTSSDTSLLDTPPEPHPSVPTPSATNKAPSQGAQFLSPGIFVTGGLLAVAVLSAYFLRRRFQASESALQQYVVRLKDSLKPSPQ